MKQVENNINEHEDKAIKKLLKMKNIEKHQVTKEQCFRDLRDRIMKSSIDI